MVSVMKCLDLGFKAEMCIKEVKVNSTKSTFIKLPRKAQRKTDICTFDYSKRVMINHVGSTLTWTTETTFSHCLRGRPGLSWAPGALICIEYDWLLKTNIVLLLLFFLIYCRSYTVLPPAYCHHSIPDWWNCGPPIHSSLYSLVQSPPKCKVLFWVTNSSMPAII